MPMCSGSGQSRAGWVAQAVAQDLQHDADAEQQQGGMEHRVTQHRHVVVEGRITGTQEG